MNYLKILQTTTVLMLLAASAGCTHHRGLAVTHSPNPTAIHQAKTAEAAQAGTAGGDQRKSSSLMPEPTREALKKLAQAMRRMSEVPDAAPQPAAQPGPPAAPVSPPAPAQPEKVTPPRDRRADAGATKN